MRQARMKRATYAWRLAAGLLAAGLGASPALAQTQAPPGDRPMAPMEAPGMSQPSWLPKGVAELQVLDKVNARHSVIAVKVGGQASVGPLRIEVQSCAVRPPNQPQDAAAFLSITDTRGESTGFRGWMFANRPALSMLQHPQFDIRVIGCRP